jgi:hypothetical protein
MQVHSDKNVRELFGSEFSLQRPEDLFRAHLAFERVFCGILRIMAEVRKFRTLGQGLRVASGRPVDRDDHSLADLIAEVSNHACITSGLFDLNSSLRFGAAYLELCKASGNVQTPPFMASGGLGPVSWMRVTPSYHAEMHLFSCVKIEELRHLLGLGKQDWAIYTAIPDEILPKLEPAFQDPVRDIFCYGEEVLDGNLLGLAKLEAVQAMQMKSPDVLAHRNDSDASKLEVLDIAAITPIASVTQLKIPADRRTKPMTMTEAGVLMGLEPKKGKKDARREAAGKAMDRLVKRGGVAHEKVGSKFVFDKNAFPTSNS